ncbi:MAG: sulfotransferase family 2 domain-containing protein, partial [Anaerolineaceae bacterium]
RMWLITTIGYSNKMTCKSKPMEQAEIRQRFLQTMHGHYRRIRELYFQDFIFIHIHKTAGSSILRALDIPFGHKTALEKRKELGQRRWSQRFSFTIVRNPWDKVVSQYCHRIKTNQTDLGVNPIPFRDWVRLVFAENACPYYDKPKSFMPQWYWVTDREARVIVDLIGRFENLEQDFQTICRRINRKAVLPHLKKSEREHYRHYYDDQTREIVTQWFWIDIDEFDYRF